jgi:hypothetical protein
MAAFLREGLPTEIRNNNRQVALNFLRALSTKDTGLGQSSSVSVVHAWLHNMLTVVGYVVRKSSIWHCSDWLTIWVIQTL